MTALGTLCLLTIFVNTCADRTAEATSAAASHYDSLLAGKTISHQIDVRHCPQVRAEAFSVTGVRGDEGVFLPRGTRLCWVDVIADGRQRTLPVTLKIRPVELVPVAACDIPARTVINDTLVLWRALPTDRLGAAQLPTPDRLGGLWSKFHVPSGSILTMQRLTEVPAVKVGQRLEIVSRKGHVEVRTAGRAMEDGRINQKVRVLNIATGRHLKGRVEMGGVVVVE